MFPAKFWKRYLFSFSFFPALTRLLMATRIPRSGLIEASARRSSSFKGASAVTDMSPAGLHQLTPTVTQRRCGERGNYLTFASNVPFVELAFILARFIRGFWIFQQLPVATECVWPYDERLNCEKDWKSLLWPSWSMVCAMCPMKIWLNVAGVSRKQNRKLEKSGKCFVGLDSASHDWWSGVVSLHGQLRSVVEDLPELTWK